MSSMRSGLCILVALLAFAPKAPGDAAPDSGELKRKGFFGAALGPAEAGVEVLQVLPGSPAEQAGLEPGDRIEALGDTRVSAPAELVAAVGSAEVGPPIEIAFVRGQESLKKTIKLAERPRETSDAYAVEYASVPSKAGRLRTILTRPPGEGKRPAFFLIQGLSCSSVDNAMSKADPYRRIIDDFTRAGYVTMRVDKAGCGDSEGSPCADVDFETELDGYRQALKALKADEGVDPARVLIFGHSMGGVMAPILAAEDPVAGVAVYGTVFKTWAEYEAENLRRQLVLAGMPYPEVDQAVRPSATIRHLLYVEKKSPAEILAAHPELTRTLREFSPDGTHVFGRHYRFFQQLADLNLPEAWSKLDAHVLALWGQAEFVSTEADHAMIAEQVNRAHPGKGTFRALEGIAHGFEKADSPADKFGKPGPGEFNPIVIEALRAWAGPIVEAAG